MKYLCAVIYTNCLYATLLHFRSHRIKNLIILDANRQTLQFYTTTAVAAAVSGKLPYIHKTKLLYTQTMTQTI